MPGEDRPDFHDLIARNRRWTWFLLFAFFLLLVLVGISVSAAMGGGIVAFAFSIAIAGNAGVHLVSLVRHAGAEIDPGRARSSGAVRTAPQPHRGSRARGRDTGT